MKILFICDEYPPGKIGGIGIAVKNLATNLVKKGHTVHVAGLYPYNYGEEDATSIEGVKIWRMRYGLKTKNENILSKIFQKSPAIFRSVIGGKKAFSNFLIFIHGLIDKERIDLVEIADWNTFTMYIGCEIQWPSFKAPLVLKAHGSYTKITHDLAKKGEPKFLKMDRALFERADAHIAVSKNTADLLQRFYGEKFHVSVLYNGLVLIDNLYTNTLKKNQILFAGSLTKEKGVIQLIKAWNLIYKALPGTSLVLFGKGKTTSFEKLIAPSAKKTVFFKGFVEQGDLMKELSCSIMAVLPSYSETFGFVAIEAMNTGCPVIYTSRASGPEIITHGLDGLLVNPDNIEEIAESIRDLYQDKEKQKKLSENARKKVNEKFDIEKITDDHIKFYKKIILDFDNTK